MNQQLHYFLKKKTKMKERSLHKEMQIIMRKIPTYLEAMFYPHLLSSQMKIVMKILNLERRETKALVTVTKKERKVITTPNEKAIWRKEGM